MVLQLTRQRCVPSVVNSKNAQLHQPGTLQNQNHSEVTVAPQSGYGSTGL